MGDRTNRRSIDTGPNSAAFFSDTTESLSSPYSVFSDLMASPETPASPGEGPSVPRAPVSYSNSRRWTSDEYNARHAATRARSKSNHRRQVVEQQVNSALTSQPLQLLPAPRYGNVATQVTASTNEDSHSHAVATTRQLLPTAPTFTPRVSQPHRQTGNLELPHSATQRALQPSLPSASTRTSQPTHSSRRLFGNAPILKPRTHSEAEWDHMQAQLYNICPKLLREPYSGEEFDQDMRDVHCVRPVLFYPPPPTSEEKIQGKSHAGNEDVQLDLVRHVPCLKHDWHTHWQWLALGGSWGKEKSQRIRPRLPGLHKGPFSVAVFRQWADALPCTCDEWYAGLAPQILASVLNLWPAVRRVPQSVNDLSGLISSLPIDPTIDWRYIFAGDPMALDFGGIKMSWIDSLQAKPKYSESTSTELSADGQLLLRPEIAAAYHDWIRQRLFEYQLLQWLHFNRQCLCERWKREWRELVRMNKEHHDRSKADRIPIPTSFEELSVLEREGDTRRQERFKTLRHNRRLQETRKASRRRQGWRNDHTKAFRGRIFSSAIPDPPHFKRHIGIATPAGSRVTQRRNLNTSDPSSSPREWRRHQPQEMPHNTYHMTNAGHRDREEADQGGAVFGRKTIWHPDVDCFGNFPCYRTPGDRRGAAIAPTSQQYYVEGDQRVSTNWGFFRRVLPMVYAVREDNNFLPPDRLQPLPPLDFDQDFIHYFPRDGEHLEAQDVEIDDNESPLLGSLMNALENPDYLEWDDGGVGDKGAEPTWRHAASLCTGVLDPVL